MARGPPTYSNGGGGVKDRTSSPSSPRKLAPPELCDWEGLAGTACHWCESTDRWQRPESLGAQMTRSLGNIGETGGEKKEQGQKKQWAQKERSLVQGWCLCRTDCWTEGSGGRGRIWDVSAYNHIYGCFT